MHSQPVPTIKVVEMKSSQLPVIESRELLRGGGQVLILHAGQTYNLRQTKENKLILTK
ncbi:MAG: hemin uptake protein HemP [Gammaproteobacteria bacterium]|nr:hemin uptake protein HemP [Gammaproteobacteria bacterium]